MRFQSTVFRALMERVHDWFGTRTKLPEEKVNSYIKKKHKKDLIFT
jgi:hypothetical protein